MSENRKCSICGDTHDHTMDGVDHGTKIKTLEARVKQLEGKLDTASDIIWDEALPYMSDVEHQIDSHVDTLPDAYRKLAAAHDKVLTAVSWRPDVG